MGAVVREANGEALRHLSSAIRSRLPSGVIALAGVDDGTRQPAGHRERRSREGRRARRQSGQARRAAGRRQRAAASRPRRKAAERIPPAPTLRCARSATRCCREPARARGGGARRARPRRRFSADRLAPKELDSQVVLQRYALGARCHAPVPKAMVFSYTVSQAGPTNIEQRHTIYRSGLDVRDETLAVDGVALVGKLCASPVATIAMRSIGWPRTPRATSCCSCKPCATAAFRLRLRSDAAYAAFVRAVDRPRDDRRRAFLPRVRFHTEAGHAQGNGRSTTPLSASTGCRSRRRSRRRVNGKPARERIVWSDYRFPPACRHRHFSRRNRCRCDDSAHLTAPDFAPRKVRLSRRA